jgi:hypothetical protein
MDRIEELLERFMETIQSRNIDQIDEATLNTILHEEFDASERSELEEVLGSLLGEVSKMADDPKEYFFRNDEERLMEYLKEKEEKD